MDPAIELDAQEARVLGVLIEKSLTTPEQYPLTLNAATSGSNQKSNRNPVVGDGRASRNLPPSVAIKPKALFFEHFGLVKINHIEGGEFLAPHRDLALCGNNNLLIIQNNSPAALTLDAQPGRRDQFILAIKQKIPTPRVTITLRRFDDKKGRPGVRERRIKSHIKQIAGRANGTRGMVRDAGRQAHKIPVALDPLKGFGQVQAGIRAFFHSLQIRLGRANFEDRLLLLEPNRLNISQIIGHKSQPLFSSDGARQ